MPRKAAIFVNFEGQTGKGSQKPLAPLFLTGL
jgi:hypothetical protein